MIDAAEICFSQNVQYSVSTIQQDASQGIMWKQRTGDTFLVHYDDFVRVLILKGGYDPLEGPD